MVLKYSQFINESKKDKNTMVDLLVKMLKDKPKIEMGKNFVTEKDAYSIAGIKKYFVDHGMTKDNADDALYQIHNDKEFKDIKSKLKRFSAKNYHYNQSYPYHYMDLTTEEASKLKEKYESQSKEDSKPEIEKREEASKKSAAVQKDKLAKREAAKKTKAAATERKTPAKPKVKKTTTGK
jgi:hypothetical protein